METSCFRFRVTCAHGGPTGLRARRLPARAHCRANPEAQMDAPLPLNPVSPAWMVFCGIVFAVPPKRPSLAVSLVVGLLLTHAVARIGSSAAGLPAGR